MNFRKRAAFPFRNMEKYHRLLLFLSATRALFRSRFFHHRPFLISHLITTRCFARCPTCLWRGESSEEKETAKIIDFYRQAKELGFVMTTFWGGEPLLREDLPEILKSCQKFDLVTGLITNGYLISKYHQALAKHLNFLIVSIDIPNEEHDRLRSIPGLFQRTINGLNQVREENPRLKIIINSVISRLNSSYIERLVQLAEGLSMSITFESVNEGLVEFPRKEGRTIVDLRLPSDREKEAFSLIQRLKKDHPSINNSKSYLQLFQNGRVKYRCHAPKICLRVEPDGDVTNCQDRTHPIGNVYNEKLAEILARPRLKWLQKKAEACSTCVDAGVIEQSLFWDFNMEVVANTLRWFLK